MTILEEMGMDFMNAEARAILKKAGADVKPDSERVRFDRNLILEQCRKAPERRIVITHGTDTMVETARTLGGNPGDRTIVLTGAMVPYKFGSSDGLFNLGSALAFVQTLPAGVYVAMNGRCFAWDRARKNRETGMFEPA